MSKTDNTRPWKIRAQDPDVQRQGIAYFYHSNWGHQRDGGCGKYCEWTMPHWALCSAPEWYVHEVWYGPERRRERDGLRAMVKDWNANYYLFEEDFPNFQHRHNATWWWM